MKNKTQMRARLKALRKKFHLGEFRKHKTVLHSSKKRVHKNEVSNMRRHKPFRYHYKRSHKRSSGISGMFGGLNVMDLALMGVGAGFAGYAGAELSKLSGGKLAGNTSQALAGVALYFIGKKIAGGKYTSPIAKGILIKTVGDLVEDHVVPMITNRTTTTTGTVTTTGATFG